MGLYFGQVGELPQRFSKHPLGGAFGKVLEGIFEFLHPDPQLDQNLKPTGNLSGHFLYIFV